MKWFYIWPSSLVVTKPLLLLIAIWPLQITLWIYKNVFNYYSLNVCNDWFVISLQKIFSAANHSEKNWLLYYCSTVNNSALIIIDNISYLLFGWTPTQTHEKRIADFSVEHPLSAEKVAISILWSTKLGAYFHPWWINFIIQWLIEKPNKTEVVMPGLWAIAINFTVFFKVFNFTEIYD